MTRTEELLALAEAATPGPWWIDSHRHCMVGKNHQTVFIAHTKAMGPSVRHADTGNLSSWRNDNDPTFIATANPETIKQLVELAVLQNEALKWVEEIYAAFDGVASSEITDAIASFERFEQGGE